MDYWKQSVQNIYVAGHRGWRDKYPENTLESFQAAIDLGVDQVETDVRVTKDGELVLIHDATLDRTTDGAGPVCRHTLAELKRLDAGSHLAPGFSHARIPTLRELMELVKDHPTLTLDLELKEYPSRAPGWDRVAFDVCDRTLATVEEYGFAGRVVINTFSEQLLDYLYARYGTRYRTHAYFPRARMADRGGDPYAHAYCACIFGPGELASGILTMEQIIDFDRHSGVQIWAGTYARDEAGVDFALRTGSVLITADNPDEVLTILRRRGLHA